MNKQQKHDIFYLENTQRLENTSENRRNYGIMQNNSIGNRRFREGLVSRLAPEAKPQGGDPGSMPGASPPGASPVWTV
uniref:Uncharacterized protein n=1 Tax=Arundo donax TaxID=35708 RepID=A0A0A8ZHU7_ARUDO